MSEKQPFQTIESYRKRQRYGPLVIGGLAIVLVSVGLVFLILWLTGGGGGLALFATDTPVPSETPTPAPTDTPTITPTPTESALPTDAGTPTAAAPFAYEVQAGDNLFSIAEKFGVEVLTIMVLNGLTNDSVIIPGQQLIIPDPNTGLPSPTPLPPGLPAGTVIEYLVLPGDSLGTIAAEFLSTEDAIIAENDLEDPDNLGIGQLLLVPINLVTPVPATATPTGGAATVEATSTASPTATSAP